MKKKRDLFFLGLFFSIGLLAILSWVFFLSPASGDNKKKLKVWSVDIEGVVPGTQVAFAGKQIGKVLEINYLLNSCENLKKDASGRYYAYELLLTVDSSTEVFEGDVITISSSGLVGERMINIIPKGERDVNKEMSHTVLLASSTNIFQEILNVSAQAKSTLTQLTEEIEMSAKVLRATLSTINDVCMKISQSDFLTEISKTNLLFHENLLHLSRLVENNEAQIHQLLNDSSELVTDLRHYGLLFQYNKAWKKKERQLSLEKKEKPSSKNLNNG